MAPPKSTPEKFLSYVNNSGDCWLWTGAIDKYGYGKLRYHSKDWLAHRLAWALLVGPLDPKKLICHICDTPLCVRPSHLYEGTHLDNQRDKWRRGRGKVISGERWHQVHNK